MPIQNPHIWQSGLVAVVTNGRVSENSHSDENRIELNKNGNGFYHGIVGREGTVGMEVNGNKNGGVDREKQA